MTQLGSHRKPLSANIDQLVCQQSQQFFVLEKVSFAVTAAKHRSPNGTCLQQQDPLCQVWHKCGGEIALTVRSLPTQHWFMQDTISSSSTALAATRQVPGALCSNSRCAGQGLCPYSCMGGLLSTAHVTLVYCCGLCFAVNATVDGETSAKHPSSCFPHWLQVTVTKTRSLPWVYPNEGGSHALFLMCQVFPLLHVS